MRLRVLAVLAALALVAVGCGSRLSGPPPGAAAGGVDGGGGAGATPASGGASGAGGNSEGSAMVGTLKAACGPGNAKGATDKGVTDSQITIGVISDRTGVVAVPTAGVNGSMEAFVAFCNGLGGINGRKLVLKSYDSKILSENDAMQQACGDDIFALVGDGSVQDDQGAVTMVNCKLVEVPAYTASFVKGLSPRMVAPVPNPGSSFNVGPARYLQKHYPDAVTHAAILWPNLPVPKVQAARQKSAYEAAAGFKFVYANPTDVLVQNWAPIISTLKGKGAEYVADITTSSEMEHLLQAIADAGYKPKVVDLGQQYYDESLPGKPGTDGVLVLTNTTPFEDLSASPALQVYEKWLKKTAPGTPPTSLGVQAFSAGLLFAQAASSLGGNLTRDGLLDALHKVTKWDGGGLHLTTNPGQNKQVDCFLYMQVKGGKFVRLWPKSIKEGTSGFDCNPSYIHPFTQSFEKLPPGWG